MSVTLNATLAKAELEALHAMVCGHIDQGKKIKQLQEQLNRVTIECQSHQDSYRKLSIAYNEYHEHVELLRQQKDELTSPGYLENLLKPVFDLGANRPGKQTQEIITLLRQTISNQ